MGAGAAARRPVTTGGHGRPTDVRRRGPDHHRLAPRRRSRQRRLVDGGRRLPAEPRRARRWGATVLPARRGGRGARCRHAAGPRRVPDLRRRLRQRGRDRLADPARPRPGGDTPVVSGHLSGVRRFAWDQVEPRHDRHRLAHAPTSWSLPRARASTSDPHTVSHRGCPAWTPTTSEARAGGVPRRRRGELLGCPVDSLSAYSTGGWDPPGRASWVAADATASITCRLRGSPPPDAEAPLRRSLRPDRPGRPCVSCSTAPTRSRAPLDTWRAGEGW